MNQYSSVSKLLMWMMALVLTGFMFGCDLGGGGGGGGGAGPGPGTGPAPAPAPTPGPTGGVCTGGTGPAAPCVSLGASADRAAAAGYAILAKTGVATVPTSAVTGNVGLSPAAKVALTGWSQTDDVIDSSSTSAQVVAPFRLYASNNTGGTTPADLTAAVLSMQAAYTDAAGRPAGVGATNLNRGAGTLTSDTLVPGTYTWGTAVTIPTDITFNGSATDVWILQIAGTLDMAAAKNVILSGGALPQNIFWQVSGIVTIGANTHFEGIILGQTIINFGNLASIDGRLLAQTAVNLSATTVTQP